MALSAAELVSPARARRQRGVTLIGLLFWAVVVSTVGLIAL